MQNTSLGIAIALFSGVAIGIQATLFTLMGRSIGPIRASLMLNVTGGIIAGAIVVAALGIQGRGQWTIPSSTFVPAVIAVILGILIVTGVALAFQRTGLAVGTATVFLGQILIGVVVDAMGWAGADAIPVDLRRVVGLMILAVAIALLVRQT
jgi:transporter family-2 protein